MSGHGPMQVCDKHWQPRPACADPRLRAWLLDAGSLTARLTACCRDFNVRVLREGCARAGSEERALFGMRRTGPLLGRDVILQCGAVPLVYAHSVIHAADLRGPWRAIAGIGTRPLGATLFADPRIERGPLAFRRLAQGHPLYCAAARALDATLPPLWARRSLFSLRRAPLLVTEAFLPQIISLPRTGIGTNDA